MSIAGRSESETHRGPTILIVEDDPVARSSIQGLLQEQGYEPIEASTAGEARKQIAASPPDLVILDINLPDELGFSLAREISENFTSGILILSARDADKDRLLGLELGADEYLTKPYNPRELVIRIRNMLRRNTGLSPQPARGMTEQAGTITFGRWVFSPEYRTLEGDANQKHELTKLESGLLKILLDNPGRVFERSELIERLHHEGKESNPRTIDIIIMRLRRKLEEPASKPGTLITMPGRGYYFNPGEPVRNEK